MFTGIIEEIGKVEGLEQAQENLHLSIRADFTPELKIDQSVSHNGVCLTVVGRTQSTFRVTAIKETLEKTNLGQLKLGDPVNLERGMRLGERLDGHIVQGHVDQTAICTRITDQQGSTLFSFEFDPDIGNFTIEKGSITIDGVSLTVVNSGKQEFSVAIIPYTLENTNFKYLKVGSTVNLEFDVIGKYVARLQQLK